MLVPLLLLIVVIMLALLLARHPMAQTWLRNMPQLARFSRRPNHQTVTVLQDGELIEATVNNRKASRANPEAQDLPEAPVRRRTIPPSTVRTGLIALTALLVVLAIFLVPRSIFGSDNTFYVLVAPFRDSGGEVSAAGTSAARQLADLLTQSSGGLIVTEVINTAPADANGATETLERRRADALIYGDIAAGGVLDQESLVPILAYRPNGSFAPNAWDGYNGRFSMPTVYALSSSPINGQVTLPPLILSLAQYSAGQFDTAYTTFGTLLDEYPALAPALPRALRGNMLWASGNFSQAADEYRRTGVMTASTSQPSELALLANNLGAILQDAGDSGSQDAFAQSVALLNNQDLPQLRLNLALDMLKQRRYEEAISALEPIRTAESPPSVLLALAEAYRGGALLDQAEQTLQSAERQINPAANTTVQVYQDLVRRRLEANITQERALQTLSRLLGPGEQLRWGLQATSTLDPDRLEEPYEQLQESTRRTEDVLRRWTRQSTAEDASQRSLNASIAVGQARRAEIELRERERWLSAVELRLAQSRDRNAPDGVLSAVAKFAGSRTLTERAQERLQALDLQEPNNVDTLVLLGFSHLQAGNRDAASQAFTNAANADPTRPEPAYGQAQIALPDDTPRAQQLLSDSIARDSNFYLARAQLADIAEQNQNWPVAIEQRRWLAENRPGTNLDVQLAETLIASGQQGYAEAERVLLPLANENNVDALLALSRLYQLAGNNEAAKATLLRTREVSPENAEAPYRLATILETEGDTAAAETQYQAAIDRNPNYTQAMVALAKLQAARGDLQQAGRLYQTAFERGADDVESLKQIGQTMLQTGNYEIATSVFERAIEQSPDDAQLHHGLGQAHLGLNRPAEAQQEEQRARDLAGGVYPEATVGLGDAALLQGDVGSAVQLYNTAIEQNPDLTQAYIGLGRAAASASNWSVAQAHFQQAVARDPNSAQAQFWNGEALIRIQNVDAAIQSYQQAIDLQPNYTEAYFGLAQAQAAAGNTGEATQNLERALKLRPDYAEAYLLQGKMFEQVGQTDEAIKVYERAINANRRLAEPYYRRALLHISGDRMNDARRDLEQAVRHQQNFPEAHYWLGRTYLADGRYNDAREQLQTAVNQRNGNYPEALYYQGLAEEQLGQRAEAIASYQNALTQDQNSAWASEAQAAITRLNP